MVFLTSSCPVVTIKAFFSPEKVDKFFKLQCELAIYPPRVFASQAIFLLWTEKFSPMEIILDLKLQMKVIFWGQGGLLSWNQLPSIKILNDETKIT